MELKKYCVVRCSWCSGEHWLVKPNIETSKALAAVAAFTSKAEAEAEAERLNHE